MTSYLTTPHRSNIMKKVKSKNTKIELTVRRILRENGYRYRLNSDNLPGKPDIVFPKHKIAFFINGCFWHRHDNCKKASMPKTNEALWEEKFTKTVHRDSENTKKLVEMGWRVVILWECQISAVDIEDRLIRAISEMILCESMTGRIHSIG